MIKIKYIFFAYTCFYFIIFLKFSIKFRIKNIMDQWCDVVTMLLASPITCHVILDHIFRVSLSHTLSLPSLLIHDLSKTYNLLYMNVGTSTTVMNTMSLRDAIKFANAQRNTWDGELNATGRWPRWTTSPGARQTAARGRWCPPMVPGDNAITTTMTTTTVRSS